MDSSLAGVFAAGAKAGLRVSSCPRSMRVRNPSHSVLPQTATKPSPTSLQNLMVVKKGDACLLSVHALLSYPVKPLRLVRFHLLRGILLAPVFFSKRSHARIAWRPPVSSAADSLVGGVHFCYWPFFLICIRAPVIRPPHEHTYLF